MKCMGGRRTASFGKIRIQLSRPDGYIYFQRDVDHRAYQCLQRERKARQVSFQVVAHEAFGLGPVRKEAA